MVRVIFDPSTSPEEFADSVKRYQEAILSISKHSYVMGMIADSYDWYPYTSPASDASTSGHNNYRSRTGQLVRTMGDRVQVWEIGNEVNGEWTGWKEGKVSGDKNKLSTMRDKIGRHITEVFEAVESYNNTMPPLSRKKTAITLLYNSDGTGRTCWDKAGYEMRA